MVAEMPALVLLVADHQDTRDMYACALRAAGFDVMEAESGADAVVAAIPRQPNVVVVDLYVRGGVTVVDICHCFAPLGVCVLVLTGVGPGREHDEIRAAGCGMIVLKPLTPDALCWHVAQLVGRLPLDQTRLSC
jgi:DNA-binding response OmpR family regulator